MGYDCENPFSLDAAADLSGSQYCAVRVDANGQAALPSAGGAIIGVLYTAPAAQGRAGTIWGPGTGIRKAKYGGTVTRGDALKVDSSGRFVTASGSDISAGSAVAVAVESGALNSIGSVILFGGAAQSAGIVGSEDIVLSATAPSATAEFTFVQTSGTQTKAKPNGLYVGQRWSVTQSVAAATPAGTITGAFKTLAGAAATTLALGTAVAHIGTFVWDGAAWRLASTLGGTASSLT